MGLRRFRRNLRIFLRSSAAGAPMIAGNSEVALVMMSLAFSSIVMAMTVWGKVNVEGTGRGAEKRELKK